MWDLEGPTLVLSTREQHHVFALENNFFHFAFGLTNFCIEKEFCALTNLYYLFFDKFFMGLEKAYTLV